MPNTKNLIYSRQKWNFQPFHSPPLPSPLSSRLEKWQFNIQKSHNKMSNRENFSSRFLALNQDMELWGMVKRTSFRDFEISLNIWTSHKLLLSSHPCHGSYWKSKIFECFLLFIFRNYFSVVVMGEEVERRKGEAELNETRKETSWF